MNATQLARRADALFRDSTLGRRILCEKVAYRESDIDDLKDLVLEMYRYVSADEEELKRIRKLMHKNKIEVE